MSSKYTLQLYYINKDDTYNLFDQPYNLYNNELKPYFEEKFFQHFMFYEIGFDNIQFLFHDIVIDSILIQNLGGNVVFVF